MDLFKFPFLAEVWGTVSDWMMIAVTATTAIFLYKTLKSQKEVQKAQNRLLEIEQLRVREQFKPQLKYFTLNGKRDNFLSARGKHGVGVGIENISINNALNVELLFEETESVKLDPYEGFPRNLINNGDYLRLYFMVKDRLFTSYSFNFAIKYHDITGVNYRQVILCWRNSDGIPYAKPTIPEIIV